ARRRPTNHSRALAHPTATIFPHLQTPPHRRRRTRPPPWVRVGAMEEEAAGPDEGRAAAGDRAPSRLRGKLGLDYLSDPTLPRVCS
uniref:Uncharacterized protein n=1 Tax=Aegilops tauschii subsp. strangulata TaxID=200361 RepID=A0A453DTA9_AEGTS